MAEPVNMLWIGRPLGIAQQLSIKTFLGHGHPVFVWVYDLDLEVPEGTVKLDGREIFSPDEVFRLHGGTHDGSLAFFADNFMLKLLYKHGGWWTHPDVICLHSLPTLAAGQRLFGPHWTSGIGTHILRSPKGDPIIGECLEKFRSAFETDSYDYHAGLRMIYDVVCKHGRQEDIGAPEEWWDDRPPYERFFLPSGVPDATLFIVHLCHSMTNVFENQPVAGSFYHKLLNQYGLI